MKISIEQFELIEKYCLGELSNEDQKLLEQIPNWEEHVEFQSNFLETLPIFKMEEVKGELMVYEAEFQHGKALQEKKQGILDKLKGRIELALEELEFLFQPVPHYQPILAGVSRSGNLVVLKPVSGTEVQENQLSFELKTTPHKDLQLTIENNLQEILFSKKIPVNTGKTFSISLQNLQNLPGRYYWRLAMNGEVVMGEFFLQKSTML